MFKWLFRKESYPIVPLALLKENDIVAEVSKAKNQAFSTGLVRFREPHFVVVLVPKIRNGDDNHPLNWVDQEFYNRELDKDAKFFLIEKG